MALISFFFFFFMCSFQRHEPATVCHFEKWKLYRIKNAHPYSNEHLCKETLIGSNGHLDPVYYAYHDVRRQRNAARHLSTRPRETRQKSWQGGGGCKGDREERVRGDFERETRAQSDHLKAHAADTCQESGGARGEPALGTDLCASAPLASHPAHERKGVIYMLGRSFPRQPLSIIAALHWGRSRGCGTPPRCKCNIVRRAHQHFFLGTGHCPQPSDKLISNFTVHPHLFSYHYSLTLHLHIR